MTDGHRSPYAFSEIALRPADAPASLDRGRPLPMPSRNSHALIEDFRVHGYCLISEALAAEDAETLRDRVVAQLDAEQRAGCGMPPSPSGNRAACNLLNKGEVFQRIVLHPLIDQVLAGALGEAFLISTVDAIQAVPGSKSQGLHIDQFNFGIAVDEALVANVGWMLDRFTAEAGATRVIPGSHLWSHAHILERYEGLGLGGDGSGENAGETVAIEGPPGTAFVFHGRLLHGAGRNRTSDVTRTAAFCLYCRPWIRPFENPFLSISDDIMASLPQALREQLGYRAWGLSGGYQMPGGAAPSGVVRPTDQVRLMP